MTTSRFVGGVGSVVVVAAIAGALWRSGAEPSPASASGPNASAVPERAAAVAASVDADPAPESLPQLRFPNGVAVAALNGVTAEPAVCVWGDHPWSPIVRREWNNGLEWYVHADGTFTTTKMSWRSDLGRSDAVTLCVHPLAAVATPYDRGAR